jgi:hypothetical protein
VEGGWAHGNHGRHGMGADEERVVIRDGQVGKLAPPWGGIVRKMSGCKGFLR